MQMHMSVRLATHKAHMGCGASSTRPIPATDDPLDKVATEVTKEYVAAPPGKLIPTTPPDAPVAKPPAADIPAPPPAPPVPPSVLSEVAVASDGFLPSDEVAACLLAIGMRKSVLMLAMSPFGQLSSTEQGYSLSEWWVACNPRSRIVIESKLRSSSNPKVLFSLVYACRSDLTVGRAPETSTSAAELRESLAFVGLDANAADAMLPGGEGTIALQEWVGGLSDEQRSALDTLLRGDDVVAAPAIAVLPPERMSHTFVPGELISELDTDAAETESNPDGGVPDFDPLLHARSALSVRNTSVTESDPDLVAAAGGGD